MGRLECTHEGKLRCKQENHELQMENEQLAKQNTLLTTRLKYDRKEVEWEAEKEHLLAQLKVCQQALEAYIIPYMAYARREVESCITNTESALMHSSFLVFSILSLDHSKTSSNQELCKSSRNH